MKRSLVNLLVRENKYIVNKDKIKKIVYFLGKSLGVLGLIFVFYKLSQEYTLSTFLSQLSLFKSTIPMLFILNFASTLLGIYAWHIMLLNYAKEPFSYRTSYYYFAKTEISKYLPGNVFHFIGRQVLSSKIGITQGEMAKISILFSFLLLVATVISSTVFAFLATDIPPYLLTLMGLSCIIIIIITAYLYPSFPVRKKVNMNLLLSFSVALQGMMLGIIVMVQVDHFTAGLFFECVSIYIVSWLIGFITPGASGGLGIREGTFIAIAAFMHLNIAAEIIIFSVLLVRFLNIIIDIAMYLSTFVLKNNINKLKGK